MFATWPMVFGALVAGLIAGFLIPEMKPKPASSSVTVKTSAKAPEIAKTVETKAAAADTTKDASAAATEDCERQTWPYLTPSCLDRSAQAAVPDVVVKTKRSEPNPKVESEPAQKPAEASAPATTASIPAAGTAAATTTTTTTDGAPKSENQGTAAATVPPAKTETPAAAKNVPSTPASNEAKQQPSQATESAPAKAVRRPPPKSRAEARAEVLDEPLRPRVERYRGDRRYERRYAGQPYGDNGPIYIERGGRLYLAPEYQHRLRGPDPYWREW